MGARFVSGLLLSLSVAARSRAGNEDLFSGSSNESDVSATDPAGATPATPGGTGASPAPAPAPAPAPGPTTSPPPAPTTPPAPEICTPEKEPNNALADATEFKTCLSGRIDSTNDVDFGEVVIPAGTRSVTWTHKESGKVTYRWFKNGSLFPAQDEAGVFTPTPGATYQVQVRLGVGANGTKPTWEIKLSFK